VKQETVEVEHRVVRFKHPVLRNVEYWITILTGDRFRSGIQVISKGKRKIIIDNPYTGGPLLNTGVDPLNHLMVTFEGDLARSQKKSQPYS